MKYKSIPIVLTLLLFSACSGGKKVDSKVILDSIVPAMCKKMAECQPNAMPSEDFCQKTMKTALSGHQNLPELTTTQKTLDTCVASIQKAECEGLLGDKPPAGCEFLK